MPVSTASPAARPPVTSTYTQTVSERRANLILLAGMLGCFVFVLIEGLPGGLLVLMAESLNTSDARIGLLVTAFALVVLVTSIPLALVARRIPRRWALSGVLAVTAAATLWSALSTNYTSLMLSRMLAALAHALFWTVALPGTASFFPPARRGRVLARLAIGNSLAPVLGIPAANWLAEVFSWRVSFWATSAVALCVFALVIVAYPTTKPPESGATPAAHPHGHRFALQLTQTALIATGAFGVVVFVTAFMVNVPGFSVESLPVILLVQGLAGVLGPVVVQRYVDRYAWQALRIGILVTSTALIFLWAAGSHPVGAIVGIAVFAASWLSMPAVISHRAMQSSPWGIEIGIATSSSSFNVGISAGSALGALIDSVANVRWIPLAGAGLMLTALVFLYLERRSYGIDPLH